MAHRYDFEVDFQDLDVAFTASTTKQEEGSSKWNGSFKELQEIRRSSSVGTPRVAPTVPSRSSKSSRFSLQRLASRMSNPGSWKSIQRSLAQDIEEGRRELANKVSLIVPLID